MYRFQINAPTQVGEFIGIVGSTPELGSWNVAQYVHLHTNADRYPLWWADVEIDVPSLASSDRPRIDYKYIRVKANGNMQWEAEGANRWVPIDPGDRSTLDPSGMIIVDDGVFGYLQPYPFGYIEEPATILPPNQQGNGLKIVVLGSSVALGYKAWQFQGWSWQLGQAVQQTYGHCLVNRSELGANVSRTIERFPTVVPPEHPDVVIIALSLGNEGLTHCPPHERRAVQRRFESGLLQLVKMTQALGARPILGGVYPNGNYSSEHFWLLQDTHQRMLSWGIPVLDWLSAVDGGWGRWQDGISFDPAHPNTEGHWLMYQAIDLRLFQINKDELLNEKNQRLQLREVSIYLDTAGFQVSVCLENDCLRIRNPSPYSYTIAPYWQELQTAIRDTVGLTPDIYLTNQVQNGILPFLTVQRDGAIATTLEVPPGADLEYTAAFHFFAPNNSHLLFYDGHLGILNVDEHQLWVINESDHEFNIHPMWQEVRSALKAMPAGVYVDSFDPDAPFRTLMIGNEGLESRVKAPPRSAVLFRYQCKLSDIHRVAIVPIGDRCAARMMLYKMGYDGPAFPFDLTRTTQIGDVADMIETEFYDMWNPAFLHYSAEAGRIYHAKWSGLSFAHEVEETDDPLNNMAPIYQRMHVRYTARSERFWYTLRHCDKALFVRTGITDRGGVMDLMSKLNKRCQGKPFHLLLLSPQSSEEFADLPNVLHYNLEFNPDRMYEDLEHWLYCTDVMRSILESLGISSKNLFWCPPNPPRER